MMPTGKRIMPIDEFVADYPAMLYSKSPEQWLKHLDLWSSVQKVDDNKIREIVDARYRDINYKKALEEAIILHFKELGVAFEKSDSMSKLGGKKILRVDLREDNKVEIRLTDKVILEVCDEIVKKICDDIYKPKTTVNEKNNSVIWTNKAVWEKSGKLLPRDVEVIAEKISDSGFYDGNHGMTYSPKSSQEPNGLHWRFTLPSKQDRIVGNFDTRASSFTLIGVGRHNSENTYSIDTLARNGVDYTTKPPK